MADPHRDEIAKLEALYASNPTGRVFVHLAEALRKAGEHARARSILEEGLARHPDSASGFVVLGRVLLNQGEEPEAESVYRRALELDPGNLVVVGVLGELARSSGRPQVALQYYRELEGRSPGDAQISEILRALEAETQMPGEAGTVQEPAHDSLSPDSAAPGDTGAAFHAETEFGVVDVDSLPGDLAALAGYRDDQEAAAPGDGEAGEPKAFDWSDEDGATDLAAVLEDPEAPLGRYASNDFALLADDDPAEAIDLLTIDFESLPETEPSDGYADAAPYGMDLSGLPDVADDEELLRAGHAEPSSSGEPSSFEEPASFEGPDGEDDLPWLESDGWLDDEAAGADDLTAEDEEAGIKTASWDTSARGAEAAAGDQLETETMGDLYRSQGLHARAADVYRALLRRRAGDERLQQKLAEVESLLAPTGEEAGEGWLHESGTTWMGALDPQAGHESPYAWTAPGDDDVEPDAETPPIAAYLGALIAWKPAPAEQGPAAWSGEAEPAAAVEPWDEPAPAGETEPAPVQEALDFQTAEPWHSGAPELEGARDDRAADPAPPTTHDALEPGLATRPPEPPLPVEPPSRAAPAAPPARQRFVDPVQDAFNDWFDTGAGAAAAGPAGAAPVEADPTDPAGAPAAAGGAGHEAGLAAAGAGPLDVTGDEAAGEDDEDLAMFRSWLQSLKK
jgi:tetratricopeptide (TPR) repeat protein